MSLQPVTASELAEIRAEYMRRWVARMAQCERRPRPKHDEARSAPYRGKVLRMVRAGVGPGDAVRSLGYERHALTHWRERCPGFGNALLDARREATMLKLVDVVEQCEAGATITEALADVGRSPWWFYYHLERRPDLWKRLQAVRPMKAGAATRVAHLVELLDAGKGWTEACLAAHVGRTQWVKFERTKPELYRALVEARERNDIGMHSRGRRAWATRRARAA